MFLGGHFFTSEQIGVTIRACDLNPNSRLCIAIFGKNFGSHMKVYRWYTLQEGVLKSRQDRSKVIGPADDSGQEIKLKAAPHSLSRQRDYAVERKVFFLLLSLCEIYCTTNSAKEKGNPVWKIICRRQSDCRSPVTIRSPSSKVMMPLM
jgi:hypothetical protein